jgi:hypothetical protein
MMAFIGKGMRMAMSDRSDVALPKTIRDLEHRIEVLEMSQRPRRRRAVVFAFLFGAVVVASAAAALQSSTMGRQLTQFIDFSSPAVQPPPLDTSVRWQRRDPVGVPVGYTNELLSLIVDANQKNSLSWPLYVQLSATTDPAADMNTSQSVGATVRAFNRSTGSPWLAGYHSEIYHGMTGLPALGGQQVDARGTSILFNGELTNRSLHGETIGLNLQNTPGSAAAGTHAINIQSTSTEAIWQNGIHFEGASGAIAGNIGLNFDSAHYNMGIDLADNSIRLNAGQKVILEKFGTIFLWYNAAAQRVELVKGGKVVAAW